MIADQIDNNEGLEEDTIITSDHHPYSISLGVSNVETESTAMCCLPWLTTGNYAKTARSYATSATTSLTTPAKFTDPFHSLVEKIKLLRTTGSAEATPSLGYVHE